LVALVVMVAGPLVFAPAASAIGNGKFSISPVSTSKHTQSRQYLAPLLTAGATSKDQVAVENLTNKPLKLDLYAADAFTNTTGAFALQTNTKPKVHMGAWIHLPVKSVTIKPSSGYIVPFTYNPPSNVAPGDYAGGIVAVEPRGTLSKRGPVKTQVVNAIAVAVIGRVSGTLVPKVAVTAVSITTTRPIASEFGAGVDATVNYSVTNTGNENLKPAVTLSLSPLLGSAYKAHVQLRQILPGSTVTLHHTFHNVVPYVVLNATVKVRAFAAQASGSSVAIVIPWGIVALVVLALITLFLMRRRRRARPEQQSTGTEPTEDDSSGPGAGVQGVPGATVESGAGAPGP
jgi:hypothetical protein